MIPGETGCRAPHSLPAARSAEHQSKPSIGQLTSHETLLVEHSCQDVSLTGWQSSKCRSGVRTVTAGTRGTAAAP